MSDLLDRLPRFATGEPGAYRPGFDRINALLEVLGRPDRTFEVVLVGGTNGKGSTSAMLSALLTAGGRTAGLHTSPHLLDVTERMRVDGRPAARDWLVAVVERYRQDILDIGPSYYEATLALSLLYFAERQTDVAVVEIGLGGRLDAANALDPDVCVITTIGLDHTDILGDTLEQIAAEKAGILRAGVPVVLGRIVPPARRVILERAAALGAPVRSIEDDLSPPPSVGLSGRHQTDNARTALAALEALTGRPADHAAETLRDVVTLSGIRGRMERLDGNGNVWVDVAHNVDSLAAAIDTFTRLTQQAGRRIAVFGALKDKDVDGMAQLLAGAGIDVIASGLPGDRALPAKEIALRLASAGAVVLDIHEEPRSALERARRENAPVLATGSHYLVAEILRADSI